MMGRGKGGRSGFVKDHTGCFIRSFRLSRVLLNEPGINRI